MKKLFTILAVVLFATIATTSFSAEYINPCEYQLGPNWVDRICPGTLTPETCVCPATGDPDSWESDDPTDTDSDIDTPSSPAPSAPSIPDHPEYTCPSLLE